MEAALKQSTLSEQLPVTLLQILSNTLVLSEIAPHLRASSILSLASTSKDYRNLIYNASGVFRYLNITSVKAAQFKIAAIDHGGEVWRNVQLDENVTEDDFYGGPLRGIFNTLQRRHILQDVQTLILDGLSVPSDLVADIITQPQFNVRVLSIREVSNLNEGKLQQALKYAVRTSRPAGSPKLKAVYFFGAKEITPPLRRKGNMPPLISGNDISSIPGGVMYSLGAQIGAQKGVHSHGKLVDDDKWYSRNGRVLSVLPSSEWAHTIIACQEVISFDAVVCRGPRHSATLTEQESSPNQKWYSRYDVYLEPRVATHSLGGCQGCGKSPEMFSTYGKSPDCHFPLLAPPPLHSSTVKAAKVPFASSPGSLLVRCADCLRGCFCESCHVWWCEDCYKIPSGAYAPGSPQPWESSDATDIGQKEQNVKPGVTRSCFQCGLNCSKCIEATQFICRVCGGGYCAVHNEGSTLTTCDWCPKRKSWHRSKELR